jgi:hypothetical protein
MFGLATDGSQHFLAPLGPQGPPPGTAGNPRDRRRTAPEVAKPVTQFSARADYLFGGGRRPGVDRHARAVPSRETLDRLAESQR